MGRDSLKAFGERLKELREKRDLSQVRLSELAGMNLNYVGDVERGERNPWQHRQTRRSSGNLSRWNFFRVL